MLKYVEFNELLGKTLKEIQIHNKDKEIKFVDSEGNEYLMYHEQDCCEDVYIEDICGNMSDLLHTPITLAEVVTNERECCSFGTYTWTYYKLATVKGYVTIRWYGESNGYYSEEVDFIKIK